MATAADDLGQNTEDPGLDITQNTEYPDLDTTQDPEFQTQQSVALNVHGGGAHNYAGEKPEGFEGVSTFVLDALPRARLGAEERLEREVARRRELELTRRARIFNAKRRTIGIDKEILDRQCQENELMRQTEKRTQIIEDRELLGVNKTLQLQETERMHMRHDHEKHCREYSLAHLNRERGREWDLNDPKAVIKSLPARIGDEDSRCGPASMQQFNGEDLLENVRRQQQKMSIVNALEQQIFEKRVSERNSRENSNNAQQCQDLVDLRNKIEAGDAKVRREIKSNYTQCLNDSMAANAEKREEEKLANEELDRKELEFHFQDKFLNEAGDHTRPDGQIAKDLYKGSTRDERAQVFRDQLAQCDENVARRMLDGSADKQHNRRMEFTRKQLLMLERDQQRMRRAMAMEVSIHNRGMEDTQNEIARQGGPDRHRNKIGSEFFEQFGVGTR